MPSASLSVLIWVITFRHTFAMKSVTYTYIFWPSILHKGIYWIIIFTLEWYWCIHGYFLSLTQIQNGCHTVVGLTMTFKLNFMDSNMTPRFLGLNNFIIIPPPNEVGGGVYWIHLVRLSVCPSVRPSVCRRHGFRSISQVCFGISISNFICMLMVAIGRSLLIFSDVTFKMAAWRPYWIFWFPDSNFTLALNINFKLQRHNTYVYG